MVTVKDASEYEAKEENEPSFDKTRGRLCELIVEKGQNYRIDYVDFVIQEEVVITDAAGERRRKSEQLF